MSHMVEVIILKGFCLESLLTFESMGVVFASDGDRGSWPSKCNLRRGFI